MRWLCALLFVAFVGLNTTARGQEIDPALIRTLPGHWVPVNCVAVTPDGETIVSGGDDRAIRIWQTSDGRLLRTLTGHSSYVASLAVFPDGQTIVSGDIEGTLKVWRLSDGVLLRTLSGHTSLVWSIAVTPDGGRVVSASHDKTVKVWRLSDGALLRTFSGHAESVRSIALTPDGESIISASEDGTIKVWRLSDGAPLRTLRGHTRGVSSVAVTPDGQKIVSTGTDRTIKVWRLTDGALMRTLRGHAGGVMSVAVTPDGQTIVSGSFDKTIKVWRLSDGALLRTLTGHVDVVMSVTIAPAGQKMVSSSADGTIRVWQLIDGALLRTLRGHALDVTSVAVTPDGQTIVSAGADRTIRVWRISDGKLLRTVFVDTAWTVWAGRLAVTPDGQTIVSGCSDGTIRAWRISDGKLLKTLRDTTWVTCVAVTPDGQTIVSGSFDRTIKVWRLSDGALLRTLPVPGSVVSSLAVTPNGQTIVSGSFDRTNKVWRLYDGLLLSTLSGNEEVGGGKGGGDVAVTPDGQMIVSSGGDKTIRIWRLSDGALVRTLSGHTGPIMSLALTPDGQTIVSGDDDSTIKIWRLSDGRLLRTLTGHSSCVSTIAVTPDGQTIVSGSEDGTINLWRISEPPVAPPLALPPSLSITAAFEEPSGDRALDAYEEAALVLRVRNTGRGPAARLRGVATGGARGVTVAPSEVVQAVQPNAETMVRIPVRADGTVRDGTVRLRAVVEEARGFNSDTVLVEFETRAERPPALAIARVALDDDASGQSFGNGDNTFQAGETSELTLFVQNTGAGMAEGVSGTVSTSAQYVYLLSPQDGRFTVGDIPAGEYREVPVVVTVAPAYRGPAALPVTLSLADRRARYKWDNLPLGISLGARSATVQTLRVQAAAERSAGLVQLPPELQRTGADGTASRPDTSFYAAVLPLECPGMDSNAALTLTDQLRLSLHQTGVFRVMERARMEQIMQEQAMFLSPCTSTSCAIEVGQILAAPFIVTGRVGKVGDTWSVTVNVVNVETSHIPAMASQTCSGCELGRLLQDSVPQAAAALAGDMLRATMRGR